MHSIGPIRPGGESPRLGDLAYREIKRLMLTLQLRPGEWYRVGQLAERLGIGRTPVRDALRLLANEGMVAIERRRGVLLLPISMRQFDVHVEARLVIEPAIAELAASRGTPGDLEALRGTLTAVAASNAPMEVERLIDLDDAFHSRVAAMSRNPFLMAALADLLHLFLRFWSMTLIDRAHCAAVWDEHWVIYGALKTGEGRRAADAARDHIETFRSRFLRYHAQAMRDPDMREMFDADDR